MDREGILRRVAACAALALAFVAPAAASSPAQELADRYAPVVMLKQQATACGSGEPYRPTSVDVVLGNPEVALVDPKGKVVKKAPTAADLWDLPEGWYLDLPGNPLHPGCSYEKQFRRWSEGRPSVVYAHVIHEQGVPDQLALQYWFYYTFNDFNDKHESDWEMIQLVFPANDAAEALRTAPTETIYSQHGGGETAPWDSSKLGKDGTHPLVYPGSGSHANYYSQNLFLGRSASEGFGCDDTRGPSVAVRPRVVVLPTFADGRSDPYAWLSFQGRWGQKEKGPNNGPTGPNTKPQWLEPITWMEQTGRSSSVVVPGRSVLGPSVAGFFCGAVARGSNLFNAVLDAPWLMLGIGLAVLLAVLALNRTTRWRPADPVPMRRARTVGQILRVAARLHRRHLGVCMRIGLVFLVLSFVSVVVQAVVMSLTGLRSFDQVAGESGGISGSIVLLIGSGGVLLGTVVATAAVAALAVALDEGRELNARQAYGVVWRRKGSVVGNAAFVAVVSIALMLTIVGIPVAIWLLVRWGISNQAIVIDGVRARAGRRESARLVKGAWFRTLLFTMVTNAIALLVGPLLGVVMLLVLHNLGVWLVNLVGSLVYMTVYPFVGIAFSLYLFDREARLLGEVPAGVEAGREAQAARPA